MPSITREEAQEIILNEGIGPFGTCKGPGKFEGEALWVPVAYEDSLNGCWDYAFDGYVRYDYIIIGDDLEELGFWTGLGVDGGTYSLFLRQVDDGFVYGYALTEEQHTRSLAAFEDYFGEDDDDDEEDDDDA